MRSSFLLVFCFLIFICFNILLLCNASTTDDVRDKTYTAVINITYRSVPSGNDITESGEMGRYGTSSRLEEEYGWVIHVRTANNETHGCSPPINFPLDGRRWIALIERGSCKFHKKIENAAASNATAVVIYNSVDADLVTMEHNVESVVSIFISRKDGLRFANLVDSGIPVYMTISVGRQIAIQNQSINKTSVLFVFVSFIILMVVSLAWLVFYYIQRFRYAHSRERFVRHLIGAAKKAINKMPTRTIRITDEQLITDLDQCAICIEVYKLNDVIRELPCRHVFHMVCVDPWLMDHHCCPMCKLDILTAFGNQVSEASAHVADTESVSLQPYQHEANQVHLFPSRVEYVANGQNTSIQPRPSNTSVDETRDQTTVYRERVKESRETERSTSWLGEETAVIISREESVPLIGVSSSKAA